MENFTKAKIIRIGIPLLRFFPTCGALFYFAAFIDFGTRMFVYAPPLQKLFYAPIALIVWAALAVVPFIFLRQRAVFIIYVTFFLGCLAFMAYDYFVPFRYVSPRFHGEVIDSGGGLSRAERGGHVEYWITYPVRLSAEDLLSALICVAPLILAFVYRRYYRLWSAKDHRPLP